MVIWRDEPYARPYMQICAELMCVCVCLGGLVIQDSTLYVLVLRVGDGQHYGVHKLTLVQICQSLHLNLRKWRPLLHNILRESENFKVIYRKKQHSIFPKQCISG